MHPALTGMKLSVLIKTHNHEAFVDQTLESVLAQRADFAWEIVVADDCSTDGTRTRLRALQALHPERIRILEREKNLGPVRNFVGALAACRGGYIALLDGDDYWLTTDKLQQQVSLLETTPELSACTHDARIVDARGGLLAERYCSPTLPSRLGVERILRGNPVPAGALTFRRDRLEPLPEWFEELPFSDWALHVLLALRGPIAYLPEVMMAYRKHRHGMWSVREEADRLRLTIDCCSLFARTLRRPWARRAAARQARLQLRLALVEARGEGRRVRWSAVSEAFRTAGSAAPELLFSRAFRRLLPHLLHGPAAGER